MKWITREKAKVDRVACPWLIREFVDSDPESPPPGWQAPAQRDERAGPAARASSVFVFLVFLGFA
jgi:hypothetical protein